MLARSLKSVSPRIAALGGRNFAAMSSFAYAPGSQTLEQWTKHAELREWAKKNIELCKPDNVYLCTGSEEESQEMLQQMVDAGTLIPLKARKNSYLARSDPGDVARVEKRTFICSDEKIEAGPNNHWMEPAKMKETLKPLFDGCMKGRTMYVVPFSMGPLGGEISQIGVQITDSAYAAANMKIMTRMGSKALDVLGDSGFFVPCMHTVGAPLEPKDQDSTWPSNSNKYIVHYPKERAIWSYGSGYGGNALLGKKCFALRIASIMAREQGWLAEHMLILGVTSPEGVKRYVAAAFPSACGKTNFAMMDPTLKGWKVECVGDDIAWMKFDAEGNLRAINPEAGFFGVAPGTSEKTNKNAMESFRENAIFTNVALTEDGDVWWDGMTKEVPERLTSWLRRPWLRDSATESTPPPAHPNSRFTAPATQCPIMDPAWDSPEGVPISAIIFGGRRSNTVPLVYQSLDWAHGTYLGANMMSEATGAALDVKDIRTDPFAMKPFCGYNFGDYFNHWLSMEGRTSKDKLPKIFYVNWFRREGGDPKGKFLWPGFGDNSRVLEWIFKRSGSEEEAAATPSIETPIGHIPDVAKGGLNLEGLTEKDLPKGALEEMFEIDPEVWKGELSRYDKELSQYGDRLPQGIKDTHARILERLERA